MDANPRLATRWLIAVLLPVAFLAMLPIVLAVGLLSYLRAFAFAIVDIVGSLLGRQPVMAPGPLQEPHFRDLIRLKARRE